MGRVMSDLYELWLTKDIYTVILKLPVNLMHFQLENKIHSSSTVY